MSQALIICFEVYVVYIYCTVYEPLRWIHDADRQFPVRLLNYLAHNKCHRLLKV
jgi:hypothetical protein